MTAIDPGGPDARSEGGLLTRSEASVFLSRLGVHLKPATLARLWSTGGDGPPCRHVRGKPYYPTTVLEVWAQGQITALRTSAPPKTRARRA